MKRSSESKKAIRLKKEHFLDLRLKEYTKVAKYMTKIMNAPESSISDEEKQLLMEDCMRKRDECLFHAIECSHLEIVKHFLEHGANAERAQRHWGDTAVCLLVVPWAIPRR